MFRFENLVIWQDAIALTNSVYLLTKKFPKEELFSLSSQIQRSSSSIAANIAEGSGSSSDKEFSHFLDISIKSLYETVSHLQLAKEQKYISEKERLHLYEEAELLAKKIRSFRNSLLKNS